MTVRTHKIGLDANLPVHADGSLAPRLANPELIAGTGAAWVRLNFVLGPWSEPNDPKQLQGRNWLQLYHHIVDQYTAQDIQVYALVSNEAVRPADVGDLFRAAPEETADRSSAERWIEAYVNNFEVIVRQFHQKVKFYEAFNEPDDWHHKDRNWVEPGWLAIMLDRIYRRIKAEALFKDVKLISGPVQGLQLNGNAGAEYLRRVYQYGQRRLGWGQGNPYPFDGVGYHLYIQEGLQPNWTIQESAVKQMYRDYIDGVLRVIRDHEGAGAKKRLYVSEIGWHSDHNSQEHQLFQANNLRLGLDLLAKESAVALGIWFCTEDFNPPSKTYGLYEMGSLNRKPTYEVYREFCQNLSQQPQVPAVTPEPSGVTNQHMINAFKELQQKVDPISTFGWAVMEQKTPLRLADLAKSPEARRAPYTGPKIHQMTGLSEQERQWLREILVDLVGQTEAAVQFAAGPMAGPEFLRSWPELVNQPLAPAKSLQLSRAAAKTKLEKQVIRTWNSYGWLLLTLADLLNLEPGVAVAVTAVVLRARSFDRNGRMTLRFEPHLFFELWGQDHPELFQTHFKFDSAKPWQDHHWRQSPEAGWREVHPSQRDEWAAFDLARSLDDRAAKLSLGMGAPQLLGLNHKLLGYATVEEMFGFFAASEWAQLVGLFDFISSPEASSRRLAALRAREFIVFASLHYGPGQAAQVAALLHQAYIAIQRLKPAW